MKIRDPQKTPPKVEPIRDANIITETRKYRLITPLFGGGVKAGEADPITVIRGASVRGQLRFWWRATRGGQFETTKELLAEEGKVWGSPAKKEDKNSGQSPVWIGIKIIQKGRIFTALDQYGKSVANIGDPKSIYSYAAFPLRDKENAVVWDGIEFEIDLRYPAHLKTDVHVSLWAWETFGGIGARTRRGFGALQRLDADEGLKNTPRNQVISWIRQKLQDYKVTGTWAKGVPHLSVDMLMAIHTGESPTILKAQPGNKVIAVWQDLIAQLQRFRQSPIGRKEVKPKPGRSYWSEPEQIRALTGKRSDLHTPLPVQVKKFPRGQFGLPIIFHFKDKGEPSDTTLQGAHHDRLGSPLILRPLICKDGAIGLGAKLVSYDPPGGYILKGAPKDPPVEINLSVGEAKKISPLNGKTDVIKAFLKTLK